MLKISLVEGQHAVSGMLLVVLLSVFFSFEKKAIQFNDGIHILTCS